MKKEHFEILLEEMNSKFSLVLEGHEALRQEIVAVREESNAKHDHTAFMIQTLNQKIDDVEVRLTESIDKVEATLTDRIDKVEATLSDRIEKVEGKVDAVASELSAHRADTEAHHGIYMVKES